VVHGSDKYGRQHRENDMTTNATSLAATNTLPRIALVGDHDPAVVAHRGIAASLDGRARFDWLMTDQLPTDTAAMRARLAGYHGVWCIPASPYRNMAAALTAIRVAREEDIPFFGSCGGFQHAVIEFMRHALGRAEADHAESNSATEMPVIAPLSCSLVGQTGKLRFTPGSRLMQAAGSAESIEGYHCSYGVNAAYLDLLSGSAMRFTAFDENDEVRGLELDGHPFFLATLFQPERAALPAETTTGGRDRVHPLMLAFVAAAAARRRATAAA
jgi:CTP synthase (UTP-ammonia lyase)